MKPIYISTDQHLRMKKLAGATVRTLQSLTAEALDLLFKSHGLDDTTEGHSMLKSTVPDVVTDLETISYGERILDHLTRAEQALHLEELRESISGLRKFFFSALERLVAKGLVEKRDLPWNDATRTFFWTPNHWAQDDKIHASQAALRAKVTPLKPKRARR